MADDGREGDGDTAASEIAIHREIKQGVDVSSLSEAKLKIWFGGAEQLKAGFLQHMVLKLQNVGKLTIGEVFLHPFLHYLKLRQNSLYCSVT
ncbi:hypothetical protein ARALYDRAFT_908153 [Arabidopsis lyrata subsp. lyrata]|uniref:Uncharacterized protein n=1 Tax=Arabidopsis lyrata subsp. lyrata TaxID=81972 RepID=D7M7X3_ARALL|nr:hypothetical protein ARALYDRAFT_908153 [Arabidopsis lyrata subsp. lyrata]